MNYFTSLTIPNGTINYDDNEFSISGDTRQNLVMLIGGSFLLLSGSFNIFTYIEHNMVNGLYFLVPMIIIAIAYFFFTLKLYIKVKSIKERWYNYHEVKLLKLTKKDDKIIANFYFHNQTHQQVALTNSLYINQLIKTAKQNNVNIERI